MKTDKIEKILKTVAAGEVVLIASKFIGVEKAISGVGATVAVTAGNMVRVATATTFGFSNLWFLGLLGVAIGLPALDIILKSNEGKIEK